MDKDWEVLGLAWGIGSKLVQWRNAHACSIRVAIKFEIVSYELDGTHNGLMMWKHFGGP